MDKNDFLRELRDIDREVQLRSQNRVALGKEQLQEIDVTVYAHIKGMFAEDSSTVATQSKPGLYGTIKSKLFPDFLSPAYAVALLAVSAIGVFALIKNHSANPYELPVSLAVAGLHLQVELPKQGVKALVNVKTSDRRYAFLTGYAKANIDVLGDNDQELVNNFALWYQLNVSTREGDSPQQALVNMDDQVALYQSDSDNAFWFQQGYSTELVQLAAKDAITDLDTGALQAALEYYKHKSALIGDHSADSQYLAQHRRLVEYSDRLSTPANIQVIVDATRAMKILVQ